MRMKPGFSPEREDMDWRYLGKWQRGEYLDLREKNQRNYTIRSFMVCTFHLVLFGRSNQEG
jgi:hypothetical protein